MTLNTLLSQLEGAELIRRAAQFDFAFKHTLVQDTAYTSLLKENRKRLHRQVGQALEELFPEQMEENAALLARHFAEAGEEAKTIAYATRAGDRASRVFAHAEALEFYSLALELSRQIEASEAETMSLYLKRGRILELLDQFDEALQNYSQMEREGKEHSDPARELAGLMARATIHSIPSSRFDPRTAEELLNQALELARRLDDTTAIAKILWIMMLLNSRLNNRYRDARHFGEESLAIARANNLEEQIAFDLNDLSMVFLYTGDPERAREALMDAREYWSVHNNLPMLSDNYGYEVMLYMAIGEYDQAVEGSKRAYAISEASGNRWGKAFSKVWVGRALLELGRIEEASEAMEEASTLGRESGFAAPSFFLTRADLGSLYGDLGDPKRGIEIIKPIIAMMEKSYPSILHMVYGTLGRLYIQDGDVEMAEQTLEVGLRVGSDVRPSFPFGLILRLAEIEVTLIKLEYGRAVELANTLIQELDQLGVRQGLNRARYLLAKATRFQGGNDAALAILEQAQTSAETSNSRWDLWQISAMQAEIISEIDLRRATDYYLRARDLIDFILLHIPKSSPIAYLRETFLNLPLVRLVFKNTA